MRNKRLWKKLLTAGVCTALVISTPVTSFAAANTEGIVSTVKENELLNEENEEEIVSDETDAMPSIEPMTVEYEPGKKFEIPVNIGSGKHKALAVIFDDGVSLLELYRANEHTDQEHKGMRCCLDHEKNVLHATLKSDYSYVKPGVHDITVNFAIENSEGKIEIIKNKNVKVNVSDKYGAAGTKPEKVGSTVKTDYSDDVTFYLKNGTEAYNIKSIDALTFGEPGNGYYPSFQAGFQYDKESGAITISADLLRRAYAMGANSYDGDGDGFLEMMVNAEFTFENGLRGNTFSNSDMNADWYLSYAASDATDESMPTFIDAYQEFDGTKDLTFQFKNGTGDNKITAIKEVVFSMKDGFIAGDDGFYLEWFRAKNEGTDFRYDLEKCEVTLLKDSMSDFVYNSWNAISNVYGNCYMIVEFADGRTGGVYARDKGEFGNPFRPEWKSDWEVKVLEKADSAEKVEEVMKKIEAIGDNITLESKEKIEEARNAYDALTEAEKKLVTNFDKLTKAEEELKKLEENQNGWKETGNGWVYYENGEKVIGWKLISETWYYFNENGIMVTGWAFVGEHWYYMNNSGAMETGWVVVDGHWYYMDQWGAMQTGWVAVDGHWYYMDQWGAMQTGWVVVNGYWYYLNNDGRMAASQWIGDYYVQADGTMATSTWIGNYYVDALGKWVKNA